MKVNLLPGVGWVLPYLGYIDTGRKIGYGFWDSQSLNKVSFLPHLAMRS